MTDPKWIETKKEYEFNERGEMKPTKVIVELYKKKYAGFEKKEAIDVVLRLMSLFAIFIPLWLFFQQQKAELNKQKLLFQLDLYSKITTALHSLFDRPYSNPEFESSRSELFFELEPKLKLLGEQGVINKFRDIKYNIPLYALCSRINQNVDTFRYHSDNMLYYMKNNFSSGPNTLTEDEKSVFYDQLSHVDSIHTALITFHETLRKDFILKETYDTTGRNNIKSIASVMMAELNKIEDWQSSVLYLGEAFRDNPSDSLEHEIDKNLREHTGVMSNQKKISRDYNSFLVREVEHLDSLMILSNMEYYSR
jgi:hypothetical protein